MQKRTSQQHVEWLRENVLDSFANDYEEFSMVMQELGKWAVEDGETFTEQEVVKVLESLIKDDYAQAYRLSPHAPHATKVEFSSDRLHELWFYVTPKGKQLVEAMSSR